MALDSFPKSRTAVITGAASTRGIGRSLARRLADHGWNLALFDLDKVSLEGLASELRSPAVGVITAAVDISDEVQIDAGAAAVENALPAVVAVVNVAGISDPTPFLDTDLERWNRIMRVNATGTFLVMKRFVPGMVSRGIGRVVNLSSTAAQTGGGNVQRDSVRRVESRDRGFDTRSSLGARAIGRDGQRCVTGGH
jgi:2-hydroxycyclohexanecarboxyl-CoA dehydrogenase